MSVKKFFYKLFELYMTVPVPSAYTERKFALLLEFFVNLYGKFYEAAMFKLLHVITLIKIFFRID